MKDLFLLQLLGEVFRQGMLSGHNHAIVAPAFQGDHPEQIFKGVADIGAVPGTAASRNPELMHHLHGSIEQHRTGMTHGAAQHGRKGFVARRREPSRVRRGQAKVPALRMVLIRRSSESRGPAVERLEGPDLGPVRVDPGGDLRTEPDPEMPIERPFAAGRRLQFALPENVAVQLD